MDKFEFSQAFPKYACGRPIPFKLHIQGQVGETLAPRPLLLTALYYTSIRDEHLRLHDPEDYHSISALATCVVLDTNLVIFPCLRSKELRQGNFEPTASIFSVIKFSAHLTAFCFLIDYFLEKKIFEIERDSLFSIIYFATLLYIFPMFHV